MSFSRIAFAKAEATGAAWRESESYYVYLDGDGLWIKRQGDGQEVLFQGDDERELIKELAQAKLSRVEFNRACSRYFADGVCNG